MVSKNRAPDLQFIINFFFSAKKNSLTEIIQEVFLNIFNDLALEGTC